MARTPLFFTHNCEHTFVERRPAIEVSSSTRGPAAAAAELDRAIARAHDKRVREEGDQDYFALWWMQSERAYNSEHAEALLWRWRTHHKACIRRQEAISGAIIAKHEKAVACIERRLGIRESEATEGDE